MKKIIKITEDDLTKLISKVIKESDPKVGTGKKPKDSDRRLYTDENPKDTVAVKFRTKQDIIDTLSKDSFKSKPHARQSQIINLIHQRLRVALERAKDSEVKDRLRTAFEYIKTRKENSKKKTEEMNEGENKKNEWKEVNGKLIHNYKFSNYDETINFVNKVEKIAKKQNHHPEITFGFDKVKITITDHEKGGVSDKCHKFTKEVDKL